MRQRRPSISRWQFTVGGSTIWLDDLDGRDIAVTQFLRGEFEPPLPQLIVAFSKKFGGTFIDVGASGGIYSLLAAAASWWTRVHAFEPYNPSLAAFQHNLALNPQLRRRIAIHNLALSDHAGEAPMFVPPPVAQYFETSVSLQADFKSESTATAPVQIARLDDMKFNRIRQIKVDIEGHENVFLRGAVKSIARHRPLIFIEILRGAAIGELAAFADELGLVNFELMQDGSKGVVKGPVRFNLAAWNHAFVPRELVPKFEAVIQAAGCHNGTT